MERRDFLKSTIIAVAGAAVPLAALELVNPKKVFAENPEPPLGLPRGHD